MTSTLIRNGRLIHATGQEQADLLIQNEIIQRIASHIEPDQDWEIIDATGKLVFPGAIDPHTHMGIPIKSGSSADNFATGSRSALHGGVTSLLDFTVLEPHQTLTESLAIREGLAAESVCDVGLHINVSRFEAALLKEIPVLIEHGFNSFKTFTTYKEAEMMLSYSQIEELARVIGKSDGILMVHAEDDEIISQASRPLVDAHQTHPRYHGLSRPAEAEAVAVRQLGQISERTGCTVYIVHLNTAEGLEVARDYPKLKIETCPHYLLLDASVYERPDGRMYVASPPLRTLDDHAALWKGLQEGRIHTLGSDHCPFCLADKNKQIPFQDIPNGMGGVATLFPTLLAEFQRRGLDLSLLTALCSSNPAQIFALDHLKGALKPGLEADLCLIDPSSGDTDWEARLDTILDWNAYSELPAFFPEMVWRRGEKVVENYQVLTPSTGRILRSASARQK